MADIITDIMVEVLKIFGIATKELGRGSASEFPISCLLIMIERCVENFLRKMTGMTDLEDALKKLDRLTQEEARMALAEVFRIKQLLQDWLSPANPFTNHDISRKAHNEGTAVWFFQCNIFIEWKSTGSLLWIHGKCTFPSAFVGTSAFLLRCC